MLHGEHIGIVEIQVISGAAIGIQVFFLQLAAHQRSIAVALLAVIDGTNETIRLR